MRWRTQSRTIWEKVSTVFARRRRVLRFRAALRAHWFRMSATAARWEEEKALVPEEMRRTLRFFGFFECHWLTKALVYDKPGTISTKIEELDVPEPGPGQVLINLYVSHLFPFPLPF